MLLHIPVPNAPPDLAEKVETALLGQVSEVADQVSNGVLVTSAAAPLKNSDRLGSPGDVVGFIGHSSPRNIQSLNDECRLRATSVHFSAFCLSAVQPLDPNIENARKSNPGHKRQKKPSRHPVEPLERDDSGENDQELRNDVDQAEQWIVGTEEHPRPCRIECELNEEQAQR